MRVTEEQVLAAQRGDAKALDYVVRNTSGLARFLARRFAGRHEERFDEAYSAALMAILDAVRKYRPGTGAKWGTYAAIWMRARMARRAERDEREVALSEVHEETIPVQSIDVDAALDALKEQRRLYQALPKLRHDVQCAVRGHLAGMTLDAIGQGLGGVSKERARQLIAEGIKHLRREWGVSEAKTRTYTPRGQEVPHGTRRRYLRGCRCTECRQANNDYKRRLRAAREGIAA